MKKNSLLIMTAVLVASGATLFLLSSKSDKVENNLFAYIDSTSLKEIQVSKDGATLSLSKDVSLSQWTVNLKDKLQLIADASKIVKLLDSLNDAKILQEVTNKKEHFDRFEISDKKATKIVMKRNSKEDLSLYLGKSKDYSSQFIRKGNDPQIYLISHKFNIESEPDRWIHKKIKLEKDDLKAIKYQTKEKKKIDLAYDPSKDDFSFKGKLPSKKRLRKLSLLANQFTEISLKSIEETQKTPKGKAIIKHSLTLKDDTTIDFKFIESKENKDSKRYFLSLDVKPKSETLTPIIGYLASLSKEHIFELHSIPEHSFQKKWDDFFEEIKEPEKKETKKSTNK